MPLNFEFKATSRNNEALELILQKFNPQFIGEDFQRDTYFNVKSGRLKLREGNIENALIHYHRENGAEAKQSDVLLYQHNPDKNLKAVLTAALGIKVVVEKRRRIWFVENVKFHFDHIEGLGDFVEVEAIDKHGDIGLDKLKQQCSFFATVLRIKKEEYVAESYSDLLLKNRQED
jgi:adenylate cyclase, class 2